MSVFALGRRIEDAVRRSADSESRTLDSVQALMRAALADGLQIPEDMSRPGLDRYVMYPAHVADDGIFSLAVAVWGVKQRTPIHDHGTWGVIGIVSGCELEDRYDVEAPGMAPRHVGRRYHHPGAVTVCCSDDDDVHAVACSGSVPTIALHAYGTDIGVTTRRVYDPMTGQVQPFVSAWAKPGS